MTYDPDRDTRQPDKIHADLYHRIKTLSYLQLLAFLLLAVTFVLALTGCQPEGGTTPKPNPDHGADRRKQPQPAPDPSALASVGNDKKSGVLHVDWTGATAYQITYDDGHGRKQLPPVEPRPDPFGSNIPGNRVDIPFVVTGPANVYIIGEPVLETGARISSCFIKWDGKEVDVDFKDIDQRDHSVRCDAPVHP